MNFTTGQFQELRVVKQFHFGPAQIDLPTNQIIEFDGQTMKFGGNVYPAGMLAGAVRAGWLVPKTDTKSTYQVKPAGVMVRPATSAQQERGEAIAIEAAAEDEAVVGSVSTAAARRNKTFLKGDMAPATPEKATKTASGFNKTIQKDDADAGVAIYPTKADDTGSEGEVVASLAASPGESARNDGAKAVARLGKPSVTKTTLTDVSAADTAIRELDAVNGKSLKIEKIANPKANADAEGGTPITATKPNGATGDVAVATSGDDLADLLPDAASSGTPTPTELKWDAKTAHWRERVKLAVDKYADNPAALNQIYAAETEAVVKNIKAQLARR